AMKAADVILFVVDTAVGITDEDDKVAALLRRSGRPVLVIANKVDGDSRETDAWTFARLGLGDPWPVSALHGRGTGDLRDAVVNRLPSEQIEPAPEPQAAVEDDDEAAISVAIVGRPNVGNSTLFNRMIRDERAIVHDMPGTTRDAIATVVETDEGRIRFV